MNRSQLVAYIAQSADMTKTKADEALSALIEGLSVALANGDEVALIGFGTFKVSQRAARTGRNPKTGEAIQIAATKAATFKAGKALKEAVNI